MSLLRWLFGDKVEAYPVPSGEGVIVHSASGCPPVEKRPVNLKVGESRKDVRHPHTIHCYEDGGVIVMKRSFLYDEKNLMSEYKCRDCKKRFVIFENFIDPEYKENTDPNVVYRDAADNPWHCGRKMKRVGYRTKEPPLIMLDHMCERCGAEEEVGVKVGGIGFWLQNLKQ